MDLNHYSGNEITLITIACLAIIVQTFIINEIPLREVEIIGTFVSIPRFYDVTRQCLIVYLEMK